MLIKRYESSWDEEIYQLFVRSVHEGCSGYYTGKELEAWAPKDGDPALWARGLSYAKTLLALDNGALAGFGSVVSGHITKLYVSPDQQGRGIGRLLLSSLEGRSGGSFQVYASKQSRRFFERQGYKVELEHYSFYGEEPLLTYLMVKEEQA